MTGDRFELRPRVLLVDDRPDNLLALRAVLEPLDFELVEANSGEEALRRLLVEEYALIVLDVQMPVLDGFETARLIKGRERTRHVPIIFLTAISGQPEHYLLGYSSGAVDYVYKPFEPEILRAKVAVFAELWARGATIDRQRAELERSNTELERLAELATNQVREPLHTVTGLLDLLADRHAEGLTPEGRLLVERALAVTEKARTVVSELSAYARASAIDVGLGPVMLGDIVGEVETALRPVLDKAGAALEAADLPTVTGDRPMLLQCFTAVTEHVVSHSFEGGSVAVRAKPSGDAAWARIDVVGSGPPVDAAELARLFTVWGSNLDLALCRKIVDRHRGRIWAEASLGGGLTICFELPLGGADSRP